MYIALPIGPNILIGNDVPERMGRVNEKENRSKNTITADNLEEAKILFAGFLSEGGDVEVPNDDRSGGSFNAMFRDKFGIEWVTGFDSAKKE